MSDKIYITKKSREIAEWFLKFGFVVSWGVCVDETITLGDLQGIVDQIDAYYRGLTD